MDDREVDEWVKFSECRINWWLGLLIGIWYVINEGTQVVIQFYIHQQDYVPATITGVSGLFPQIIICASGICVLMMILGRSLSPWLEFILVSSAILICFAVSGWESGRIEHYIINSELKEECYQVVILLFNTSQLLLIPIWYGVRFIKQTPLEFRKKNYFLVLIAMPIIVILSAPIFDILQKLNIMPMRF